MNLPFRLRPIIILIVIYYLNILSRIALAPLLPIVESELGLGHAEAGSLFLFITLGYCAGLLGSTLISSRLNHRRTILLSAITLGGAMLFLSRSVSASSMHGRLLLIGIGSGLYLPSGIATLTELVRKEHWGKVMATNEMAPTLALITAPLLVESLLRVVSWRDILAIVGASSILSGGMFLFFGQGGSHKGVTPNPRAIHTILGSYSFWIMATVLSLAIGGSLGLYTMLPLFLVNEIGFRRELANTVIGFSRVFGVVMLSLSGMLTDRVGPKRAMALFFGTAGILTLMLGTVHGQFATPMLIFLQATSLPCLFSAAFAMVSFIFPSHLRSLSVSLLVLIGFLSGAGVVPPVIGHLAERISFSFGFSCIGILILSTLPLLFYLRTYPQADG